MTNYSDANIGRRVRIIGSPAGLHLTTPYGTIMRLDELGNYIIQLDEPAIYSPTRGEDFSLSEVRYTPDNFICI